jgi:hypothetical protein
MEGGAEAFEVLDAREPVAAEKTPRGIVQQFDPAVVADCEQWHRHMVDHCAQLPQFHFLRHALFLQPREDVVEGCAQRCEFAAEIADVEMLAEIRVSRRCEEADHFAIRALQEQPQFPYQHAGGQQQHRAERAQARLRKGVDVRCSGGTQQQQPQQNAGGEAVRCHIFPFSGTGPRA